ncbi:MAG: SBBP repeat-containing protein [Victivallales bacterium]
MTSVVSGSGTMNPDPLGGVLTLEAGVTVPLIAVPDPLNRFVNWTASPADAVIFESGAENFAHSGVTVMADVTLTANFAAEETADLTLDAVPPLSATVGTLPVFPGGPVFNVEKGLEFQLIAIPVAGNRFVQWNITGSANIGNIYSNDTWAVINGDATLTAVTSTTADVFAGTEPSGAGTVESGGLISATVDAPYDITATAGAGYVFTHWESTGGVTLFGDTGLQVITIQATDNGTVTAHFTVAQAGLHMSSLPAVGGTTEPATGMTLVDTGFDIPISATPVSGYTFQNWNCSATGGSLIASLLSPDTTINVMPGDTDVFATALYAPSFQWAQRSEGGFSEPRSIKTDAAGNVFVAGVMNGNASFGPFDLTMAGTQDFFIAKYNPSGTCTMAINPGRSTSDITPKGIAVDAAGNIYVGGSFTGDATIGGTMLPVTADSCFVAKFNSAGVLQWVRHLTGIKIDGTEPIDWPITSEWLVADAAGNVYVTGSFISPAIFEIIGEDFANPVGSNYNVFLAKIDTSGACQWIRTAATDGVDVNGLALAVAPDGSAVGIGGRVEGVGDVSFDTFTVTGDLNPRMFIALYDADGTCQNALNSTGGSSASLRAMDFDASGNLYFAGTNEGPISFAGAELEGDVISNQVNIGKIGIGGSVWMQQLPPADANINMSLAVDNHGDVLVTSLLEFNTYPLGVRFGDISLFGADIGLYLAKYDTNGDCLFAKKVIATSSGIDRAYGMDVDGGGNCYLAGTINMTPVDLDVENFMSTADMFLAKLPSADSYANLTLALGTADSAQISPMVGTMSVLKGEPFRVSADISKGYHLIGWSVDSGSATISGSDTFEATVTLAGDATVTLNASLNTGTFYYVNIYTNGQGSVSPDGMMQVYSDEWKEISATANPGYHFVQWVPDGSGVALGNDNLPNTRIRLTESNRNVNATFAADGAAYTLTPAVSGSGTTSPEHPVLVGAEEPRFISAEAGNGYHFVNWTVTSGTATFVDSTSPETYATLTENATITANFTPNTTYYNLTIVSDPTFGGTSNQSPVVVAAGEPYRISATANDGYHFISWTSPANATFTDLYMPTTYVRLTGDATVTANFATSQTAFITMAASGDGTVTPTGRTAFSAGETVQITAISVPAISYFVNWTSTDGRVTFANEGLPQTTITVYGDDTVTANFAPAASVDLTMSVSTMGDGDTSPVPAGDPAQAFPAGDPINIVATANAGKRFTSWTASGAGTAWFVDTYSPNTMAFVTGTNVDIKANFAGLTTLTVTTEPEGAGTVTPAAPQENVVPGNWTAITATPLSGYEFVGWQWDMSDFDISVTDPGLASTIVSIGKPATITAVFKYSAVTLNMASLPAFGGTTDPGTGPALFTRGIDMPIQAIPVSGWVFQNWDNIVTGGTGIADLTSPSTSVSLSLTEDEANATAFFAPAFQWAKRSTGDSNNQPYGIKIDASGNAIVVGSMSANATFGTTSLTLVDVQDIYIAKYNSTGTCTMSVNPVSSDMTILPRSMDIDSSGSIYVAGDFEGIATFGATTLTAPPGGSHYVAKFNAAGAVQWAIKINDVTLTSECLAADNLGHAYLTGFFMTTPLTIGLETVNSVGALENVFLAKIDGADGGCLWLQGIGANTVSAVGLAIAVDAAGNPTIGGALNGLGQISFGSITLEGGMDSRMFVAAYDTNGDCMLATNSTGGAATIRALNFDAAGNLYFAGTNFGAVSFGGISLPEDFSGVDENNLGKIDNSGTILWMNQLPMADMGGNIALAVDSSGNAFVSTHFASGAGASFGTFRLYDGLDGLYLAKYNGGGICQFAKKVIGPLSGDPRLYGIDVDANGNLYMTGRIEFENVNLDVETFLSAGVDTFIAKIPGADSYAYLTLAIAAADSADLGPMIGTMSVLKGEPFSISAEVAKGYHFVNWAPTSGSPAITDANAPDTTVTLTSDATVTLNASLNTGTFYYLSMNVIGSGSTSQPCIVYSNEWKEISATASAGSHFVGWTKVGGASFGNASSPETSVKLTTDATVTANFAVDGASYTLTPAISGSGSTQPAHPVLVSSGEPMPITAEAGVGYHFINWTAGAGSTIVDVNSPETYAILTANATITANFAPNTAYYNLTIVSSPTFGGTTSETTVVVASGEPCQISATANYGYHFTDWTSPANTTFVDANLPTTYVRLSGDATVTANFATNQTVFLTMAASGAGTVTPSSRTALSVGESQQITAIPTDPFATYFVNWTMSGNAIIENTGLPQTNVVLYGDSTVTANFAAGGFANITVSVVPALSGTTLPAEVGGPWPYGKGEAINLEAYPEAGFKFLNWSINSGTVSIADANSALTTAYMTSNASITANFTNTTTLTISSYPEGAATLVPSSPQTVNTGELTEISAVAGSGYEFVEWIWDISDPEIFVNDPMSASTTVSITSPATITAVFRYTQAILHMASLPALGGTTNPPAGTSAIDRMVDVPISAIPIAGYTFQNWSRPDCFGPGIMDLTSANTIINLDDLDDEAFATAIFAPSFKWAKRSTGGMSAPRSVKADAAGNVFVAGTMAGDTSFGSFLLPWGGGQDLFIAKYNSSGTCTMAINAASSMSDISPTGLAVDSTGNIYVGGWFIGDVMFGATPLTDNGNSHFVAKFNAAGELQWVEQLDQIATTSEWLVADTAGNVYLTGSFSMPTLTISGVIVNQIGMKANSFLAKLDADGNCTWIKTAGGSIDVDVLSLAVAVDADGNTAIGGTLSAGIDEVSFGDFDLEADMANSRMFIATYDASGTCLSAMNSTGGPASAVALDFDASGNLYFAGKNEGGISLGGLDLPDDWRGVNEANIGKISSSGNVAWMQQLQSISDNVSLAVDGSGDVFVSSAFDAAPEGTAFGEITLFDMNSGLYVAKYDATGECLFAKKVVSTSSISGIDRAFGIDIDASGNLLMTGRITDPDPVDLDVDVFTSSADIFIAKLPSPASYTNLTLALGTADSADVKPMVGTMAVLKGEPFSISAEISAGYHFVNWTKSSSNAVLDDPNALETTVTLTGDATVTLNTSLNTATYYNLTMAVSGSGAASPSGIVQVYSDEWTDISATAAAGFHFVNWTKTAGATLGSANSPETRVKLTSNATVTANFAADVASFTLTPAVTGSGSTEPAHPVLVTSGEPTLISAEAGAGYHFVNWTKTAGTIVDATSPVTYATLTGPATITANFVANSAVYCRLSQVASPSYGGNVDAGIVTLDSGEPHQISATAAAGYHFTGWTAVENATFTDAYVSPTFVRLTGDSTVTANFAPNQTVFLTTAVSGPGTVTPTGRNALSVGESQQITAAPTDPVNYYFAGWTVSGSATVANPLLANTSVVLTGDATVTANFAAASTADLTMTVAGNGMTLPPDGLPMTYNKGEAINIMAMPDPGNRFLYWTVILGNAAIDDVNSASTNAYITGNATINATFSDSATLTMFTEPAGAGTVSPGATQVVTIDSIYPIVATPNSGYEFVGWSYDIMDPTIFVEDPLLASTNASIGNNAELTAVFRYTQAALHLGVLPSDGGTTDPAAGIQLVNRMEPVGLTATAGAGYAFQNWDNLDIMAPMDIASPSANIMIDTFTDEASVNAIFAPKFQWAQRSTGDSSEPRAIKTDSLGNAIVAGVMSNDTTFASIPLSLLGAQDIYIAKYNSSGAFVMAVNPASSDGTISPRAMALDSSGNIYVAGDFTGNATFGATTLNGAGDSHFVAKFNSAGVVQWAKQLNDVTITSESLAVDSSGNVYLTGYFTMIPLTIDAQTANPVGNTYNMFLAKLNTSGACQWIQSAGTDGIDLYSLAIAFDSSGNVALGGSMQGAGSVSFGSFTVESSWDIRMFIATYDAAGTCQGAMNSTGGMFASIRSLEFDNVGNLYFTGTNWAGLSFGGFNLPDDGAMDMEFNLGKMAADGSVQWMKQLPLADVAKNISLAVDDAGNAYVSAYFNSAFGASFGTMKLYDVSNGLYIAKYNTSGICSYAKKIIGCNAGDPRNFDIDVDVGGNLFMAGRVGIDNVNLDVDNFISVDSDTFIAMIAGAGSANLTMAVALAGTGAVTPDVGTTAVLIGEPIHISADGAPGYEFTSWAKTGSATITNASASATTVTLTGNATVTASFAKKDVILTMAKVGEGSTTPAVGDIAKKGATAIAITATPATGHHFVEWEVISGSVDIVDRFDATTSVTMYESSTIQATFEIDTYIVTYTAGANGTVVGTTPQSVLYQGDCTLVTATPNAGYYFVNWKKGSTIFSTDAALTVTNVTATMELVANFAINTYAVTFTAGANGSITGTKNQTVNHGADCTAVTPVPAANYHFTGWTGDHVGTENPLTLTNITAVTNATANFARNTATLTMAGPNGTTTPAVGSSTVVNTQTATAITATAAAKYHFVNWTVTVGSATIASATSLSTTVTLTGAHASAVTVTANFAHDTTTLTMAKTGNGTTNLPLGANTVDKSEDIPIVATPAANNHFLNWTAAGSATVAIAGAATTTANLTGPGIVTANFAHDKATLEIAITGTGTTDPVDGAVVEHDTATAIPIVATPAANWHFVEWNIDSGDATIADANAASTTVTLEGDDGSAVVLNAVFEHDTANLTMVANGDGTTTPVAGASVVNTATAVNISAANGVAGVFTNWTVTGNATLGAAATTNANTVTLMGNATVTANFYDSSNDLTPPADDKLILGEPELAGTSKVYKIVNVPADTTCLKVWTDDHSGGTVGSGDCDIYVKPGEIPSTNDYYMKSTKIGFDELIEISNPVPGDWYVLVYAYADYQDVFINIETSNNVVPKRPLTLTASDDLSDKVKVEWTVDLPDNADFYQVYRANVNSSSLAVAVGEPQAVSGDTTYVYYDEFPAGTYSQYFYWVKAMTNDDPPLYSAFSDSDEGKNTAGSAEAVIKSGTAVTISGVAGSIRKYKITVPASSATVPLSVLLDIRTSKGTGDCDLEVLRETTTELKYSRNPGNAEIVRYDPPTDGATYVISVIGKSAYTGVSLVAKLYTKAPAVPSGVAASDGTYSDMIIVSWKEALGASIYEVWRHDSKITVVANISTTATKIGETADISFVDNSTLDDTKTYYYWVRAKVATPGYVSAFSSSNSGYITKDPVIPKKMTASDAKYFDKILVTWPAMKDATSYHLFRSVDAPDPLNPDPLSAVEIKVIAGVNTAKSYSYEDMGDGPLAIGSIYYYWIKTENANGTSGFSAWDSGKLKNTAPASVAASDGTYFQSVKVTWAAVPGATTYNIYRTGDATPPVSGGVDLIGATLDDSTSYLDVIGADTTKYFYWVEADYQAIYQSNISTSNSGYAADTTPLTLPKPVIKTVSKGTADKITVTWGVVPLAEDYFVFRKGPLDADYNEIAAGVTDLFFDDTDAGLVVGTLYSYCIQANNNTTVAVSGLSSPMSGSRGLDSNNVAAPDGYTEVANGSKMFDFTVPAGISRLVVTVETVTADGACDIYAKAGSYPTTAIYNAKGAKVVAGANTVDTLTVKNPLAGQWYVLLNETTAAFDATITIRLYTATNIIMTTVPVDNQAAPFKTKFKGRVLDQDGVGIKDVQMQVRNPLTMMTYNLAKKTDVNGYWTYDATIGCEGEHTFDFFIGTYPEEGLASWTVKTRKLLGSSDTYFDMSEYLTGTTVDLADAATMEGMETYLNLRRGNDELAIFDPDYEAIWLEDTMDASSSDTEITDRLDSGLYFLLYGFEGAACGNDLASGAYDGIGFNFTASPLLVRVAPDKVDEVIANLLDAGLVDNVFVSRVVDEDGIGVVVVGSVNIEGKNSGLLSASEQLELLGNIAGNSTLTVQPSSEKAGDSMISVGVQSDIDGGAAKFNVKVGAFTK